MCPARSKFAFDELLPRWLDSMTTTLDGDISQHTLILTLGTKAQELCVKEQQHARHQCVLLPHWLGPDRMLHFGDEWCGPCPRILALPWCSWRRPSAPSAAAETLHLLLDGLHSTAGPSQG